MTAEPLKPLPCPWCQKPPTIRNVFNMFGMVESADVYCPEHTHGFRGKTQQEAIAAWNRRAEPEELPEWVKLIIMRRISHLQESVDATEYDDNKYAWNFAIEELEDILSLKKGDS